MKKIIFIIFLITFGIFAGIACEIDITSDKSNYKIGESAVIIVTLTQDHKKCLHEGEEPKIKVSDLEMIGKTTFKEIENGIWQIKYKALIKNDNPVFIAIRECEKDGAEEIIKIKVI